MMRQGPARGSRRRSVNNGQTQASGSAPAALLARIATTETVPGLLVETTGAVWGRLCCWEGPAGALWCWGAGHVGRGLLCETAVPWHAEEWR